MQKSAYKKLLVWKLFRNFFALYLHEALEFMKNGKMLKFEERDKLWAKTCFYR